MEEKLPAKIDGTAFVHCTETCPNCCSQEGSQRLAQIKSNDVLRNRALTFSMIVSGWIIVFFSLAALLGKSVTFPAEFWGIVMTAIVAPWIGVHGGQVLEAIALKIETGKRQ